MSGTFSNVGTNFSFNTAQAKGAADPTDAQDLVTLNYADTHYAGTGDVNVATDPIWNAKGDLAVGTASDLATRLAVGTADGMVLTVGTAQPTGIYWATPAAAPSGIPATFIKRTAGDYLLNSTSFANLDTGLDLTIAAAAGDILEIGIYSRWGADAVNAFLDVATIVSASPVNYISGGTGAAGDFGVAAWVGLSGLSNPCAGAAMYTVQAGDISGGNVLLRIRYRTSAAVNKTLRAGTSQNDAFFFTAKNLG